MNETLADKIKVALCEAMIDFNGDNPIIPPTAINWIGDALTIETARALGLDPDTPGDRVLVAIDPATLPKCRTCEGDGHGDCERPECDMTCTVRCPDCNGSGHAPWVAVALDPLIAEHLTVLLRAATWYGPYYAHRNEDIPAEVWDRLREVLK